MQATLAIYAHQYVYDAWNRLVAVWVDSDDSESRAGDGSEDIATYQYDGLGRRIVRTDCTAATDVVYHDYYTPSWQLIEVRKGGKAYTDLHKQFVWGLRYIDAPILRDRETNAGSAGLDERLYYTQDGNFNVTALVNPAGDVVERYSYDAYGQVTVRNGAENVDPDTVNDPATEWDDDPDNASDVDNRILYCGYRYDGETGLYHVRHRYLHPTFGRWTSRDPMGYVDGMGLHEYSIGSPIHRSDPSGTTIKDPMGPQKRVVGKSDYHTFGDIKQTIFSTKHPWTGKQVDTWLRDTIFVEVQWEVVDDHTLANPLNEKIQWPVGWTTDKSTSSKTIRTIYEGTKYSIETSTETTISATGGKEDVASIAGSLSATVKEVHSESSSISVTAENSRGQSTGTSSTPAIPVAPCKVVRVIVYQQTALFYRRSYTFLPAVPQNKDKATLEKFKAYEPSRWRDDAKRKIFYGKTYLTKKKTRIIVGDLADAKKIGSLRQFSK